MTAAGMVPWPWGDPRGDQRGIDTDNYTDEQLDAAAHNHDDEPAATSARARLTTQWLKRNTRQQQRYGSGE